MPFRMIQVGTEAPDFELPSSELTPEGKRLVQTAFRSHAAELEAAMSVLNETEKRRLYGLLKKLGLLVAEKGGINK